MSTMFSSSSGLNKSEITVTSNNQILNGYKDYDSNGNLLTGTNAGYDAGVTQGENNMKSGITVTDASHIISGYKARTSNGTLVTGNNAGYSSGYNDGVAQGHADRDSGVTITDASQILSGYKGRDSSGTLLTGTDAGYNAGVAQGHADRDSGVTVTSAAHVLNGYKARTNTGTLVTGTAVNPSGAKSITANGNGQDVTAYATVNVSVPNSNSGTYTFASGDTGDTKDLGATNSYRYVNAENVYNKGKADRDSGVTVTAANQIVSGYKARNSSGTLLTGTATTGGKVTSEQTKTVQIRSSSWSVTFSFSHGVLGIKSMSDCAGIRSISISGNTVSGGYSGNDKDYSMTVVGY